MAKDKRKRITKPAPAPKKKAVKRLKPHRAARVRPVRKPARPAKARRTPPSRAKPVPAKRPLKDLRPARKAAAPVKAAPAKPEGKKGKPTIKSTKRALEVLEARVNEGLKASKAKGGRPSRKGRKGEWLLATAELPREDAETRRTRLKNLIKLGKERGFLTYAEINDHLPDVVDAEQIESMITTFNDMGIQVFDQAPDAETLIISEATPAQVADEDDLVDAGH